MEDSYTGHDLILCMGVPGSRWSGSIRAIQTCKDINTSDDHPDRIYDKSDIDPTARPAGWHRGCYWGPYHEYGHNFDILPNKQDAIKQFRAPFKSWDDGIKIIKSHWFSYHIPKLREWFPEAKLVAFYVPEDEAFEWWHEVGGWDITYPHYDWYENDQRMREQIEIENTNILEHFELKNYNLEELTRELGLSGIFHDQEYIFKWDPKIKTMSESLNKHYTEMLNSNIRRIRTGVIC